MVLYVNGAPERIRTSDPQIRRLGKYSHLEFSGVRSDRSDYADGPRRLSGAVDRKATKQRSIERHWESVTRM